MSTHKPIGTLSDILPVGRCVDLIEVRTNSPYDGDILFGFCKWNCGELISLDGDSYSVFEEIYDYQYSEDGNKLTYWFISDWISG